MRVILVSLGAVFISTTLVYLGNGLLVVLLPLRGVAEGFPLLALGSLGSAYALGFIIGCLWFGPFIIRRVGHIRGLSVFASAASAAAVGYAVTLDAAAWLFLRVVSGAALAGVFMIFESWLNERANNATRGRIFSLYLIINYTASVSGQLAVAFGDPRDFALFAIASVLLSFALIPVSLTTEIGPAPIRTAKLRIGRIFQISPISAVGALLIGLANSAFATMAVVFAAQLGLDAFDAALFLSAAILGAALGQTPAGWLSDRIDRRIVIIALAAIAAFTGLLMALNANDVLQLGLASAFSMSTATAWTLAAVIFGAFAYTIYGVCAAHMNDFVERDGFVEAASSILLLWSVGAIVGPILASSAMSLAGAGALFFVTALAHAAVAGFAYYRMTRRSAPSTAEKGRFVAASAARATPQSVGLDPRAQSPQSKKSDNDSAPESEAQP